MISNKAGTTLKRLDTGGPVEPEVDPRLMQRPVEKASKSQPPMTIDGLCVSECPRALFLVAGGSH